MIVVLGEIGGEQAGWLGTAHACMGRRGRYAISATLMLPR